MVMTSYGQGGMVGHVGAMGSLCGMRVIENEHLPKFKMVQYRFPKSKSLRIKKKWRKDDTNFKQVPISQVVVLGGNTLIMSAAMRRQMEREYT